MKDTKLVGLLKSLSPEEFKDFEKFVASPYFSKGRDLVPFFRILKQFYPGFSDESLTQEFVFSGLFPGKKFDKVRSSNLIKTLSSQLFIMSKDFLIQIELNQDENKKRYFLLNQLRKKKLYQEFERTYKSLPEDESDPSKGTVGDFIAKYFIELAFRDYSLDRDDFENSYEANLKTAEYTLLAGLINTFKHQDEINIARGYNLPVRENLLKALLGNADADGIIKYLRDSKHPMLEYIEVYYLIYKMNIEPQDKSRYYLVRKMLQERAGLFGQIENYTLWNILLSYCNISNLPVEEHFYIFDHILENGIYRKSDSEDFHIVLFRNIVLVASSLNKIEWLRKFLDKYSGEIHPDHRTDMRQYTYAMLNFSEGDFGEALALIQKIRFELFLYKPDMRVLQLKIFYKLEYYEQLHSITDSTLHFLRYNKELREEFKDSVKNLIKYIKELVKIKTGTPSKSDSEFLRKKIKEEAFLGQRQWLLDELKLLGEKPLVRGETSS